MAMIEIKGASAGPGLLAYAEAIETVFESASRNRVDQSVLLEAVRGLNLAAKGVDQVNSFTNCELKNWGLEHREGPDENQR